MDAALLRRVPAPPGLLPFRHGRLHHLAVDDGLVVNLDNLAERTDALTGTVPPGPILDSLPRKRPDLFRGQPEPGQHPVDVERPVAALPGLAVLFQFLVDAGEHLFDLRPELSCLFS